MLLTIALAMALVSSPAPGSPVHGGGVGSCEQCHVMHDALAGQVAYVGRNPLLLAANSTDLCLMCHGADGVFGVSPLSPPAERGAGNFVWLLEDNLNDAPDGNLDPLAGEVAGHNIVSPTRGVGVDSRWLHAPGGSFPSSMLGCTSCHDPHGSQAFRMLNGAGPVQGGQAVFLYPAPVAEGLSATGAGIAESPTGHSAYHSGMSAWCANCHGDYHSEASGASFRHPVEVPLGSDARRRYDAYAGDADPAGGSAATSYLPEVPFEGPQTAPGGTAGPAAADRLTCLTCHRAHASSAPAAGRWDFRVYRLSQDGLVSGSYALPSPYPGDEQGQLCRKCHAVNHDQGQTCLDCHRGGDDGRILTSP